MCVKHVKANVMPVNSKTQVYNNVLRLRESSKSSDFRSLLGRLYKKYLENDDGLNKELETIQNSIKKWSTDGLTRTMKVKINLGVLNIEVEIPEKIIFQKKDPLIFVFNLVDAI